MSAMAAERQSIMRARLEQSIAGYRLVKRYRRLHEHLINLIQVIHDSAPEGMMLDNVKLVEDDGYVQAQYTLKPVTIEIVDGEHRFTLKMTKRGRK